MVVDFWGPGCGDCRALAPSIERLAREHPDIAGVALDVERPPRTADRYGIEQLTTVIRFRAAEPVAVGALPLAAESNLRASRSNGRRCVSASV